MFLPRFLLLVHAFFCSYRQQLSSVHAVSQGAVRFVRNGYASTSQGWSSGIVQIYYSGRWGNICYGYNFGYTEADVLCHQFSYSGSSSHTSTYLSNSYGTDSAGAVLDDVDCHYQSSYLSITQCTLTTTLSTSCHDDVIVDCYSTRIWNSPTSGDIRLTGGMYSNQGLLEVYCNGEWGTVCDDNFYSTQATVACKQLGYNDYFDYNHLTQQGSWLQSIWLGSLSSCTSCQSCLTRCSEGCPYNTVSMCTHTEDVTLECEFDFFKSDVFTKRNTICNNANFYPDYSTDCSSPFYPTESRSSSSSSSNPTDFSTNSFDHITMPSVIMSDSLSPNPTDTFNPIGSSTDPTTKPSVNPISPDPTDSSSDSTNLSNTYDSHDSIDSTDFPNFTNNYYAIVIGSHQLIIGIIIGVVTMGCLMTITIPFCIVICILAKKRSQQTTTTNYTQMTAANNPEHTQPTEDIEVRNLMGNQAIITEDDTNYSDPPGQLYNNSYELLQDYEGVNHPESLGLPPSYHDIYQL